jgi:hypothetical protein
MRDHPAVERGDLRIPVEHQRRTLTELADATLVA